MFELTNNSSGLHQIWILAFLLLFGVTGSQRHVEVDNRLVSHASPYFLFYELSRKSS